MKKKLVHLQVLPLLSGVQRVTLNIFKSLDQSRYELYLICAEPEQERKKTLISEAQSLGVKVIVLPELKREIGWHDLKAFFSLLKIFRKYRFDIIHTHSSKPGFLGRIAGKLSGCKAVIHTVHGIAFHAEESFLKRQFYRLLEMVAGLFNDKLILVSNYYRKKFWFVPQHKIVTIYNGIDLSSLEQKVQRNDGLIRLISVGRLDRAKSPSDLIKALELCVKERDNLEAKIVGDGEYYNFLKEYIAEKGLEEKIKLLGWREDVAELLASSDIFVSSSIYEAFGLVYCEAGYTGLPVVATRVEGIPEVVVDQQTGILVSPQDPQALAQAVLFLADHPEKAAELGNAARSRVSEEFNLARFTKEYKEIYELY